MSWEEDRKAVLEGIQSLRLSVEKIATRQETLREETRDRLDSVRNTVIDDIGRLKIEVAVLKTKLTLIAAGWGVIASVITSVVTATIINFIKG